MPRVYRLPIFRRLSAIIAASALALAPITPPGPTGPAAASLGGPPAIETLDFAPLVGEFTVEGQPLDHLVIIWDEILDRSSVPAPSDFRVTINNGAEIVPTQVAHLFAGVADASFAFGADGASFMRIDLPTTYSIGDDVLLDYIPGSTPIRDLALTPAQAFSDVEVLAEDIGGFHWLTSVIDSYHGADKLVFVVSDPIEPASLPAPAQFQVLVGVDSIGVSSVTDLHPEIGLGFIELSLEAPITDPDAIVQLEYTSLPGTLVSRYRGETFATLSGEVTVLLADSASGDLGAGDSLSTADPGGTTPEDPVAATITTTGSGPASIEEGLVEGTSPTGYSFFGQEFEITMPDAASAEEPNVITFLLDASILPAGEDATSIQLFRDGALVLDCAGTPGTADPSPCVSERVTGGDGSVTLTVLTIQASTWNTAIVQAYEFGGFLPPVDPVAPNLVNAGRAIPLKFSLGGDRGLDIFEDGSPSARLINCADLTDGGVEEPTATAGYSGLTYNGATDRYHYVWKTNKAWNGSCRRLVLDFADGSQASAIFDFRR